MATGGLMARKASAEPVALRAQLPEGVVLSAHEAAEAIQAANTNVVRLVKVSSSQEWQRKAQTDPGFVAATVLVDSRAGARQNGEAVDDAGVSQGACVEEWVSLQAAEARFQTLSLQKRTRVFRSHGAIQVLRGNLILRVSEFLDLDEAQQYIDAFLAAGVTVAEDEPEAPPVEDKQLSLSARVLGPRLAGEYVGTHSVELFQNGFVRVASDPPERLVALVFNELRGGVIQRQGQSGWNRSPAKVTYLLVIVTERSIRLIMSDGGAESDLLACRRIDIASRMMLGRATNGRGGPVEMPRGAGAARTYAAVDERVAQLDDLHDRGLISEGQYQAIRQRMWGR